MKTPIKELHEKFYIPDIKIWNLIFHMYSSWVPTTVAKNGVMCFSTESIINMLYVVVIMHMV